MTDYEFVCFFSLRVQAGYKTLGLIKRKICDHTLPFRSVVLRETCAEEFSGQMG